MTNKNISTKPRYELLDGLRGVAALMVIIYHTFECFPADTWIIGHGYLAVDFFFILSGFVIGYAYDDRWVRPGNDKPGLSFWGFVKRRLIRLHPMVIMGVIIGVIAFIYQGGTDWAGNKATISAIMLATLLGMFLIPATPGGCYEVRGNGEMFPLNGPHWSLFFEYIGNLMYALFIRRFSTTVLTIWTLLLAVVFAWFCITDVVGYGNIGVGWTIADGNFYGGLLRMTVSYSLGLLMSRVFKPAKVNHAFLLCSLIVIVLLSVPCLGTGDQAWINCTYEVACVLLVFPIVVWLAACGSTTQAQPSKLCTFLGDISYPLYAVHYPSMYVFYAYIGFPETWRTPAECWQYMALLVVGNIILAYAVLKLYDLPLRRYLTKRLQSNK